MTRDLESVRDAVVSGMARHRADLETLIRIPSVSAEPSDPAEVRRAAEAVRDLLDARGFERARLLEVDGAAGPGHPAVAAEHTAAGPDSPTVLLYAHHDVQPPGDAAQWTTPAFEPTERDGRLFARGAADDKAGILVHVAAVDAWLATQGRVPVNVKVLIEGEEEIGSPNLHRLLERHGDALGADLVVVTDSGNASVGVPAITYALRGLADCVVEVRALDHAVHSGMYGGPVPDAITGLVRVLAGLTDDNGAVVAALSEDVRLASPEELDRLVEVDETALRADAGVLQGVELIGDPAASLAERLWMRPSVTVTGIDAPSVAGASNALQPVARAHVSLRLAPGQDPVRARERLVQHLEASAPWGLRVTVTPGAAADPYVTEPTGPVFEAADRALAAAFGVPVVYMGVGGTIPLLHPLTQALGGVPALLTGVEDPDTRAHGPDESLHLADWQSACLGEAYLFAELAAGG